MHSERNRNEKRMFFNFLCVKGSLNVVTLTLKSCWFGMVRVLGIRDEESLGWVMSYVQVGKWLLFE